MTEYLDTVVRSGQVNTPPGSYRTVKEWGVNSFMGPHSTVLEIGCSTGFITTEVARYTGATCIGVDLHGKSVATAEESVDGYIAHRVSFKQADAAALPFDTDSFSHVIVSGYLPFVPAEVRKAHITEAVRVLHPWGYLLIALYYYRTPPPQQVVEEFNAKIGTKLSVDGDRPYWISLFDGLPLTLEYNSEYEVLPGGCERTEMYLQHLHPETREDWKENLRLFNENGEYLNYFVQVYRKVADDPHVLLQLPRGGIYQTKRISRDST